MSLVTELRRRAEHETAQHIGAQHVSPQWRLTWAAALATWLTALSLSPTLLSGSWLPPLTTTVVLVALAAGGARSAALPRPAVTAVAGACLLLALTLLFARDVAVLWVLPGPAVWERFATLTREGLTTIWHVAPPVPVAQGIEFVIAAGVGCIAVAVDAVAVSWRRAAASGVALLVLYLVPASVLEGGVPWPLFALGALGWLGLLLSDGRDRLSRWGLVVSADGHDGQVSRVAVAGTGRRLAAVALGAAVVIPLALPMLTEGVLGSGQGEGGGDGTSGPAAGVRQVVTINPLVDLRRDLVQGPDTVVLRYTTDDPTPEYLRIATLDQFDGRTWTLASLVASESQQASAGLPPPPGLSDQVLRAPVTTDIQVAALDTPRLPLPYPVTKVVISGDWRWDPQSFDVFTPAYNGSAAGLSYQADSLAVAPTAAQLREADPSVPDSLQPMLQVPSYTALVLRNLTARVTAGTDTNYDAALAIQNWFRTTFQYSTATRQGNGLSDLQAFLKDRSGFCEQFAATMALMARVDGIPSRVQVGFTPGTRQADGSWLVTAHDAHAWPELWFNGVGWVRFEPTPGGGDGVGPPSYAPPPGATGAGSGQTGSGGYKLRRQGPGATGPGGRQIAPNDPGAGRRVPDAASTLGTASQDNPLPLWPFALAVGVLLAVGAVAPLTAQRVARHRRWSQVGAGASAAEAAWTDVLESAADVDLRALPTETPRDVARRFPREAGLGSQGRSTLATLVALVERDRYSDSPDAAADPQQLRGLARAVHDELFGALSTAHRRRATLWPASGRARVGELVGAAGARMDSLLAAGGRRVRAVSGRVRRGGGPNALRSGA